MLRDSYLENKRYIGMSGGPYGTLSPHAVLPQSLLTDNIRLTSKHMTFKILHFDQVYHGVV